jgi:hypothetical protein
MQGVRKPSAAYKSKWGMHKLKAFPRGHLIQINSEGGHGWRFQLYKVKLRFST